jgi:hypothetical protein
MDDYEQVVFDFATVTAEAVAISDAVLAGDLNEVRFRANLLVVAADIAGLSKVAAAAADLVLTLGPAGTQPQSGYGANLIRVADELDAVSLKKIP